MTLPILKVVGNIALLAVSVFCIWISLDYYL